MKTKHFLRNAIQAVALCLTATMLSFAFSACSDKDPEGDEQHGQGGIPGELIGTWYGEYSSRGEITKDGASSRKGYYVRAVQGLKFNADGTGTCYKYLCDIAGDPISIYGGSMDPINGKFHFTVKDDSIVTITRDGDGDKENPKKWTVINGSHGIMATDGTTEYNMQTASEEEQGWLTGWEQLLRSGDNDDETEKGFLKAWEDAKTVNLSKYGTRNLPWYGAADNDIPEDIRFEMKKEDGWEMAFCMLNDPSAPTAHMFALYNRFTGVLRVYQYIEDAMGYGKELFFNVVNDSHSPYRYPFYNAMVYCIPVNKKWNVELRPEVELVTNGNTYMPFRFMSSAYTRNGETTGVATNWHCFDLDLSAYMPKNDPDIKTAWRKSVDAQRALFSIGLASQNVSDISLAGHLLGDIAGTTSTSTKSSSANSDLAMATNIVGNFAGLLSTSLSNLNCICGIKKGDAGTFWNSGNGDVRRDPNGNGAGNGAGIGALVQVEVNNQDAPQANVRAQRRTPITGGLLMAIFSGIVNIASATLKSIPNPTTTTTEGDINLQLNAKIDMKGKITQWVGLRDGGVTVTPDLLDATKVPCSIGTGCFGLADDPVICIAKEDLLSSSDHINMTEKGDKMMSTTIAKDSLRIVAFLDPTSIKFMLNTDIYHNIKDLTINANYGVDLYQKKGHTDSYRRFMSLSERPTFKLNTRMNDDTSTPRLHKINPWEISKGEAYPKFQRDSIKVVEQTGSEGFRFFGPSAAFWGKNCMMDPQVFVPYTGSTVDPATVPDFFVSIEVSFTCDEAPYGVEFCKRFLPKYKLLSRDELMKKYTELTTYAKKCEDGEAVGSIANDAGVKYHDYISHKYLTKTLTILKKIKDDTEED